MFPLKKAIIKVFLGLFGGKVRLVTMGEHDEKRILKRMAEIDGIHDWLELQKQAGYALFARTEDRQYLGYSTMAQTISKGIEEVMKKQEEEIVNYGGYESTA